MRKIIAVVIAVVIAIVAIAGCGGTSSTGTTGDQGSPVSTTEPSTSKPAPSPSPSPTKDRPDPYEVYLDIAPKGEKVLSREDAQARALLGCEQEWAPGTVDAALREAYGHLCEEVPQ